MRLRFDAHHDSARSLWRECRWRWVSVESGMGLFGWFKSRHDEDERQGVSDARVREATDYLFEHIDP